MLSCSDISHSPVSQHFVLSRSYQSKRPSGRDSQGVHRFLGDKLAHLPDPAKSNMARQMCVRETETMHKRKKPHRRSEHCSAVVTSAERSSACTFELKFPAAMYNNIITWMGKPRGDWAIFVGCVCTSSQQLVCQHITLKS